jgi:hypothetical protein
MGIATFPAGSSGLSSAIRSVQRGEATVAGNITISSVDTTKTMVNSFSTGSAGSVAASGVVNAVNGSTSATAAAATTGQSSMWMNSVGTVSGGYGTVPYPSYGAPNYNVNNRYGATPGPYYPGETFVSQSQYTPAFNINGANVALNAANISGGSTSLTSAVYGVYLVNATTIYATGPCRYEVIEHY